MVTPFRGTGNWHRKSLPGRAAVVFLFSPLATIAPAAAGGKNDNVPFDFRFHVAPVFARAGCAAAECHGGATGRGGFKLSLFATDPRADYSAVVDELGGRRIDLADPENSLLLKKPSRAMKHGGGRVLRRGSHGFDVLKSWIESGAPLAAGPPVELDALAVSFAGDRLKVGARFRGLGESGDGRGAWRDVTASSRFESTNPGVASVDEEGGVTVRGPGETYLLARFAGRSARVPLMRSFAVEVSDGGGPAPAPAGGHRIDGVWLERLGALGFQPASAAGPHRLLRRLYLDLVGRPPAPDEIAGFLAGDPASRVASTADALMGTREFAETWGRHLWDWFEIPRPAADLRHTTARNVRLRGWVSSWLEDRSGSLFDLGKSVVVDGGASALLARFEDPRDRAEFVGRSLLGLSIGCARCHNHPGDRWSQAQHLQFSACFAGPAPPGPPVEAGRGAEVAMGDATAARLGAFFLPGESTPVTPVLLPLAGAVPSSAGRGGGGLLTTFLMKAGSPYFARNAANRVFGILLGKHLVESPDDHRAGNPAVHGPLLDVLAEELAGHGFELRPIVKLLVTSQIYQASSRPADHGDGGRSHYFARREARPMPPEVFEKSVRSVTGFAGPWPPVTNGAPLARQLQVLNSGVVQRAVAAPGGQVGAVVDFEPTPRRRLEALFLLVLSRPPRDDETEEFLPDFESAADPVKAARDLAFALVACREFSSLR